MKLKKVNHLMPDSARMSCPAEEALDSTRNILTISEITRKIKGVLELGFPDVWVRGEISNFKRHTSGHLYFTLKDEGAQLQAVMWRGLVQGLFFTPQEGMKVIAHGRISLYEPRGSYQIVVSELRPLGVGELQLAFERLKSKLASEGLFDEEHKKPLPEYPETIGVVTSPSGAAIQDIVSVISRRFPSVLLILRPVKVQGEGAADEISRAIKDFNEFGCVDVIIVSRGGGSLEDLWAFNEESVARAIYASNIPVVSAVGHQIDFTISDFVADVRAATPSAAAEMVVSNRFDLLDNVGNFYYTMSRILKDKIDSFKIGIGNLVASYSFAQPRKHFEGYTQRVDELSRSMDKSVIHLMKLWRHESLSLQKRINSLSPELVLKRGYAIVSKDGQIMVSAKQLRVDDDINVRFSDGTVKGRVVD
jgi:exodeoxyribonuclease VII large subunit